MVIVDIMGTTNQRRIWAHKPHLVDENCDISVRWEDDDPYEGWCQSNAEIWSVVVGLKKHARMQIFHSSVENTSASIGHRAPK
ncbi:hypothetical protein TNCV_4881281 [Trichonephila clavipes]|nr:hypothetical protein TNCV_4881281 [Trichonephila clavipes]